MGREGEEGKRKGEKNCESECGVALTILILHKGYKDVNIPPMGAD